MSNPPTPTPPHDDPDVYLSEAEAARMLGPSPFGPFRLAEPAEAPCGGFGTSGCRQRASATRGPI